MAKSVKYPHGADWDTYYYFNLNERQKNKNRAEYYSNGLRKEDYTKATCVTIAQAFPYAKIIKTKESINESYRWDESQTKAYICGNLIITPKQVRHIYEYEPFDEILIQLLRSEFCSSCRTLSIYV